MFLCNDHYHNNSIYWYIWTLLYRIHLGIYIRSDGDIVVQANSMSIIGSSAWEVPPINKLGKVHVVMTYIYPVDMSNQGPYEMMVVASHERTFLKVELRGSFTTSITFNGHEYKRDHIIEIWLNKHQVAQVCQRIPCFSFPKQLIPLFCVPL